MPRYQELRLLHGYTQEFVAETIGVSRITYIRYENGDRQIKVPELLALAQLYHVSIDYILGLSNSPVIILDTKEDPSLDDQERVKKSSTAALNGIATPLTEADRQWLEQYVDTAICQALGKHGTQSDDSAK